MNRHHPIILSLLLCFFCFAFCTAVLYASEPAKEEQKNVSVEKKATSGITKVLGETKPKVKWSMSVGKIFWALAIIFIAYQLINIITRILENIAEKWVNTRLSIMRIVPFIRILVWTGVIYIIVVAIFAPPIETLLALTASASIALGFSSQDILKNVFGGLMILVDRPFQIGDKIQVKDHYGEVVQIGLRTVRIVTPDDSLVSIPNSDIVNQSVSNANNGETNCQVVTDLYLPMGTDFALLKQTARRAVMVSRYTYLNKPIAVLFKNEIHEGRSLIKMRIKAYVLDIRYEFAFASDISELVIDSLLSKGLLPAGHGLFEPLKPIGETP